MITQRKLLYGPRLMRYPLVMQVGLALLILGFGDIRPVEAQPLDEAPVQGKIAYITMENPDDAIYLMNADGTGQHLVFSDGSGLSDPALSPDGKYIAFVLYNTWRSGIYVINVDGTNKHGLTGSSNGADMHPLWSPNGKKILYSFDSSGTTQFYTMNPDGKGVYQLAYDKKKKIWPAWSPDGKQIIFAVLDGANADVYVMNADGTNSHRLATWQDFCQKGNACVGNNALVWSPDGSTMAFESDRGETGVRTFAIYTMNADGSNMRRVTPANMSVSSPAWSPDGKRIAFVAYEGETITAIDIIDRDGANLQTLIRGATYLASPSWSK